MTKNVCFGLPINKEFPMNNVATTYSFSRVLGNLYETKEDDHVNLFRGIDRKSELVDITTTDDSGTTKTTISLKETPVSSVASSRLANLTEFSDALVNCSHGFTLNLVYLGNSMLVNQKVLNNILDNNVDFNTFFIYNGDIEYYVVSSLLYSIWGIYTTKSGKFNQFSYNDEDENIKKYIEMYIESRLNVLIDLMSIYSSYSWNYVINADNLTGTVSDDFSTWFDNVFLSNKDMYDNTYNYEKQQFINDITNYDTIKQILNAKLTEYGMASSLPITRSDI